MVISGHKDLEVYRLSFSTALEIFAITKSFPVDERYALSDQIRRSSRSICACIAEGYRKRRYAKHFISKLIEAESEAAETQTWLEFSMAHAYIDNQKFQQLNDQYEHILAMLTKMITHSDKWTIG